MHQPPGFENTALQNFKRFGGPSGCSAVEPLMEAPAAPHFEDDVDESDYCMVLGILGRITPENYDAMKAELIALPIRQLTDEEITEVVKMMYDKAVRPEDALYTEMYARLMADLVHHTGVHGVGKTIRKAIIDKCQHQFEQPFVLPDEDRVDAEGNPLPDEDIQIKSMQLKERHKCNIKFLGHLFLCGMVNEKVVNFVLFHLLYGKEDSTKHTERHPEEYEVEMFCDLLKKVGKNLTPKTQQDDLPGYMKSLENLRAKTSKRLMFVLMDLEELWRSGWEPCDAEIRQKEQQDMERALQQQQLPHQPPVSEITILQKFKRFGGPSGCSAVEPLMEAPAAPQFEDDVDDSNAPQHTLEGLRAYYPPRKMKRIADCIDDDDDDDNNDDDDSTAADEEDDVDESDFYCSRLEGLGAHYPPHQMERIADCIDDEEFLTSRIREWAAKLWPEGDRPDKLWTREDMFSDKKRTLKTRKQVV